MKQTVFAKWMAPWAMMLLAMPLFTACSQDEAAEGNVANGTDRIPIVINSNLASQVDAIATRGTATTDVVTPGTNTVLATGLDVDLFISEYGANSPAKYNGEAYYLKTTAPTGSGASATGNFDWFASTATRTAGTPTITKYWPATGNGLYFFAYYPAGAITGPILNTTTTTQQFVVATAQGGANGSLACDLMLGVPSANPIGTAAANPIERSGAANAVNLQFKHLLSKVVVVIQGDGTSLAAADEELTDATVTLGPNMYNRVNVTPNTGAVAVTGSANATFTLKSTGAEGVSDLTNYCIIPPQTLTGKTISVQLKSKGTANYTIPQYLGNNVTAEAGKVYKYTITIGLNTLSRVTLTVDDWDDGNGNGGQSDSVTI